MDVDDTLDVDESAERAVMNAELPRSTTLPLVVVIVSSADTVLSVHIRPMFAVLGVSPPRIAAQSFMEDGSTFTVGPTPPHGTVAALVVCKGKAAAQAYKSKR